MSTPFSQTSGEDVSISLDPSSNSQGFNNNGGVNINFSLNLPSNLLRQNQMIPVSSQFCSHQNGSFIPGNMDSDNISDSKSALIQNSTPISIKIKVGNNPPINVPIKIDLLNNNLSSQFSSPYDPNNNVINSAAIPRDNNNNEEIPFAVPIPYSRQSSFFGRHIISERNRNVSLIRTSTGYIPLDFSSSTVTVSDPQPLRQQSYDAPPGFFPRRPDHMHSRIKRQTKYGNLQGQSMIGCKSCEPEMGKSINGGGSYKCPKCAVTFSCVHRYASHAQSHYKHESRDQKKERRGGNFKRRDLHIAQTSAGISIMPGPRPRHQHPLLATSTTPTTCMNAIIKEETQTD